MRRQRTNDHPVRRLGLVLGAMAGLGLAVPATAGAHGLVQRSNLPIPEWLFGWAATVVLVVSFVALAALWPRPRMQDRPGWRPLPWRLGHILGSRAMRIVCGLVGVGLLVLVVVAGYVGSDTALDNFAPTFVLITFWVGLAFAGAVFGDLFAAFSPWRAIGRVLPWREGLRPYPERLGRWPAALSLFLFTWIELASGWSEDPDMLVTAILGYTVITLAAQVVWGVDTWSRRGEGFAVYFNLLSRLSPFEARDGVVGVRPPLSGLPRVDTPPGTVAFVVVMIGTVTFDGLSQGTLWKDLSVWLTDRVLSLGFAIDSAPVVVDSLGLVLGVALIAGFYQLGVMGARSVGGDFTTDRLRRTFAHTLVPIAAVYVVAHYLTFLLFEGQAVGYLASDPLGRGWDLLGTATAAIDYSLLSQNAAWYLQVGFVVVGHVAALILAHDRALAIYSEPKQAVRSQYWMLTVMVGFTTLALWLLAQAGA